MYHLLQVTYFFPFTLERDCGRTLMELSFRKVYLQMSIIISPSYTSGSLALFVCVNFMMVVDLLAQIFMQQGHQLNQFNQLLILLSKPAYPQLPRLYTYRALLLKQFGWIVDGNAEVPWWNIGNNKENPLILFANKSEVHNKFQQQRITMNNDDIYAWIVSHPQNYPGRHLMSQARTFEAVKPLDPKAQFHLIFKGLGEYIRENMASGRGINYRGFGAFAFEVDTDLVKPAQLSNFDISKQLSNQREQRMHNHRIRPCFVADKQLFDQLIRHPGKQEIDKPKSQHSIYQKGFGMIYCNPVPIANSCYIDKETTQDALNAFAKAVADLTSLGKTMEISLNVLKIKIVNRNLTYTYNKQFAQSLNFTNYEKQMKKSLKQTKSHWTDSYDKKWNESTLGGLITKPKLQQTSQVYEKGLGLKIMSLDFNTTETVHKNKHR